MTAMQWALLLVFGVPAVLLLVGWIERHPDRMDHEQPPLIDGHGPDRVAATADNLALADEIAVKHPMRHRPPVAVPGPGWREDELPELDPVTANRLHTEWRGYLADAAP